MACSRQQLSEFLDNLLEPERFQDYCPNGLQVEGKNEIHRLVTGVTASQALIDEAIKRARGRNPGASRLFLARRAALLNRDESDAHQEFAEC